MYYLFCGINIVNIENVTINISAQDLNTEIEKKEEKTVTDVEKKTEDTDEIVDINEVDEGIKLPREDMDILIMCFKENREKALKFLNQISNMKDCEKTALVNRLVRRGEIEPEYKHHQLWSVLHKNGLYSKSESNWYKIVL